MKKALVIALILLLLATGCRRGQEQVETVPASPAATPKSESPASYAFSFTARTLNGETVTEEVFGQYDLVLVNVWASWCPPCRGELSELGVLYGKLPENVGFLSVTVDYPEDLDDAKALLEQNNCAFPCLDGLACEGLDAGFLNRVQAIPTTVFFDGSGNEVGEWIIGVPQGKGDISDAYLSEIQSRLDLLNGK